MRNGEIRHPGPYPFREWWAGVHGLLVAAAFFFPPAPFAPSGTRPDVIQRMAKEMTAALQRPEVRNQYRTLSSEVLAKGPPDLDAHVASESAKWGKVIRERSIKIAQ